MTSVSFFVFQNISFTENNEDDKDNDLISHVLYQYKNHLSTDDMNNLLNVIVSLYTFTTISMEDKEIRLLSFDSFKIAIHTLILNDHTPIFFVLRLPNDIMDQIIQSILNKINDFIFFALGNTVYNDIQILKDFLNKEGDRILDMATNTVNLRSLKYKLAFPSVQKFNCDNCAIIITTLMSSIQKLNPKIWGSSCFLNNKLLISQIPISLCSLFPYIPIDENQFPVFLTRSHREMLIQNPNSNFEIPNLDLIPSLLLNFTDSLKKISFYVLTDLSLLEDDIAINKIKEKIDASFSFIYENSEDLMAEENVDNSVSYNSDLFELKVGKNTEDFEENLFYGRSAFLKNNRLTEIIMKTFKDFTICYKIISFEHYSFIEDNGKDGFLKMYKKCTNLNPSLKQYIDAFSPNELV